jgi:hypothetical protein
MACDCIRLIPGGPHFAADLDRIVQYYPVAAEGVVSADGPSAWRFFPTREYRGRGLKSYPITLIIDCSLAPDEMKAVIGKPIFALLAEGPGDHRGTFELSRCVNLQSPAVEKEMRARLGADCPSR